MRASITPLNIDHSVVAPTRREGSFAHPVRNISLFNIEPGMRVADFGSGSGAYVLSIAEALAGSGHVYAIDVQRDLLRRIQNDASRRGLKNVEIIWSDLEKQSGSKISDANVDIVLISNLLFQVPDKPALLREAARVLKRQGRLIIIDWSESYGGIGPQPKDVVDREQALSLGKAAGFELVRQFEAGAHHYGLILRK